MVELQCGTLLLNTRDEDHKNNASVASGARRFSTSCVVIDPRALGSIPTRPWTEFALVCVDLVVIEEGLGVFFYSYVKMVERTIGRKPGTGGSSGVGYLASTLFNPVFPDLWAIRSQL